MSNVSDYVSNLQQLTKKNLEILNGINKAFYTKSEHLNVNVGGETYLIPSFISLENKLHALEDNIENLINAPKTGEAVFNFNGNTQTIEVKGFSNTPKAVFNENNIIDNQYNEFDFENNNTFKDFCTPRPFVKFNIDNIPDDIHKVLVKKIIPVNDNLIESIKTKLDTLVCTKQKYSSLVKELYNYEPDKDFIEYDKVYELPIRGNLPTGEYKILDIIKNWTDNNLDEYYTLKLDNTSYFKCEETLQYNLNTGDYLVSNNDKIRLKIENILLSNNEITVKVEDGGYIDLCTYTQNQDLGTLRYLPSQDWSNYKYINISLEEDQYIYIFVSPIERNSNIQSNWSYGLAFNIYNMKCDIDGETIYFKDYYDKFVKNIGDTITGLANLIDKTFVNFDKTDYGILNNIKPQLDDSALFVVEVNKHLHDSKTIQSLYDLYKQKKELKQQITDIQNDINNVQNILNNISFTDSNTNRTVYEQQIKTLNVNKKELTQALNLVLDNITKEAVDTTIPIKDPKYRIRGFFDYDSINNTIEHLKAQVIGIDVQYRYRNVVKETGLAETFDKDYIYSDWNQMISSINKRRPFHIDDFNNISFKYDENTNKINEISFNQIDIPITQGEKVDIRLRVIYNIGYPFIEMTSQWSNVVTVDFPETLQRNITVLNIIEENNNDIKNQQFDNALEKYNIITHVNDNVVDQNISYLHNALNISSGFYTQERRVIPLFDKLKELNDQINILQDEVLGTESDKLTISVSDGDYESVLTPYIDNTHIVRSYINNSNGTAGYAKRSYINVNITNTSNRTVRLYSIFPYGSSKDVININSKCKYDINDYISNDLKVYFVDSRPDTDSVAADRTHEQVYNQILYFRIRKLSDGSLYYRTPLERYKNNLIFGTKEVKNQPAAGESTLFPLFTKNLNGDNSIITDLCTSQTNAFRLLQPGETIRFSLMFLYNLNPSKTFTEKTISFDIRTSLYKDPINYILRIGAKYNDTTGDYIRTSQPSSRYNPVIVSQVDPRINSNNRIRHNINLRQTI